MGNLLFCREHDVSNCSSARRKGGGGSGKEVEPRPLPLTGKQPLPNSAADQLGLFSALSQRMTTHHQGSHTSFGGHFLQRYRRTADGAKNRKSKSDSSSKSAVKSSSEQCSKQQQHKFVSCSSLAYSSPPPAQSKATSIFPSGFSNLKHQEHNHNAHPHQPNRSLSHQPSSTISNKATTSTMSRKDLSIRHRKYPMPSVAGGRTPTLKVPLKNVVPSYGRSVSLAFPATSTASPARVHSATSKGHQSFKMSSSSSSASSLKKTPGRSLAARKKP